MITEDYWDDMNEILRSIKSDFGYLSANYDLIVGKPIKEIGDLIDGLIPTIEDIDENIRRISGLESTIENIDDSLVRIADALERIAGTKPKVVKEE